jgi:hypothetical protein
VVGRGTSPGRADERKREEIRLERYLSNSLDFFRKVERSL